MGGGGRWAPALFSCAFTNRLYAWTPLDNPPTGEFVSFHNRPCQGQQWETHFRELEAFVVEKGRLPRRHVAEGAERVLSNWLKTQGSRVTSKQMPAHQLQRLLTARSDLIRRRVEGWITGDPDGVFQQNCRELREYIEMNGQLPRYTPAEPDSSSCRLAMWLRDVQKNGVHAMPERRRMLEEVDFSERAPPGMGRPPS